MDFLQILKIFEQIELLNGKNWLTWKFKFETALKHAGLWDLVNTEIFLQQKNNFNLMALDQKARTLIGLWVDDPLVFVIKNCSNANQMWKALISYFENDDLLLEVRNQKSQSNDDIKKMDKYQNIQNNTDKTLSIVDIENQTLENDQITKSSEETLLNNDMSMIIESPKIELTKENEIVNFNNLNIVEFKNIDIEDVKGPTLPNLSINDLALYPILRKINQNFLKTVDQFYVKDSGNLVILITKDKSVYSFGDNISSVQVRNSRKKLKEILTLKNKNIKSFVFGNQHYMALTDDGHLYGNEFSNTESFPQLNPVFIMEDVAKVCCGYTHVLILDHKGRIWTFDTILYGKLVALDFKVKNVSISKTNFQNQLVKDIACSKYGSVALTKDNKVFIWGKLATFAADCPIEMKICEDPLKSIHGGLDSFTALTTKGYLYWCHIDQNNKFRRELILVEEPIELCFQCSFYENYFLMVSISGLCYVWDGNSEQLIRTLNNSIPDSIALYTTSYTPDYVWTCFPSKLVNSIQTLHTFNNPMKFDFFIYIKNFERKPIYVQECLHLWYTSDVYIEKYPYSTYYHFLCHKYTGQTIITADIIAKALKLVTEYQQQITNDN